MNIDTLLAPISATSACGDDLSFSTEFDAIQELRRADDPTLDQGEWVTALKVADWPAVLGHCTQLLSHRSKDLRAAAWFTDASARISGYAGLADGLLLCRLLCERYWDDLHPRLDDDGDAEQRSGSLRWLLAQVEVLARRLPVLRRGANSYSLHDMESARTPAPRGDRSEDGTPGTNALAPDDIAAARKGTSREFLAANLADTLRAQQALDDLQHVIDSHLGGEGPAFSSAKGVLADAVHAVERLAREADPLGRGALPEPVSTATTGASHASDGTLRTRADALRQLRAVADFFRHTEPHSPVAYLAERAAQWGDMPLHTWLRSVLKDAGSLSQLEQLLGVEPPAPQT